MGLQNIMKKSTNLSKIFMKNAPQTDEISAGLRALVEIAILQKQLTLENRDKIGSLLALYEYNNFRMSDSLHRLSELDSNIVKNLGVLLETSDKSQVSTYIKKEI